mmetsp:Transcript_9095/g.21534  ORF Transcript_9095/g.21534 Transcript_9095/m.21534 type:complete len:86 (+) Transcript_9095:542-799(+)
MAGKKRTEEVYRAGAEFPAMQLNAKLSMSRTKTCKRSKMGLSSAGKFTVIIPTIPTLCKEEIVSPKAQAVVKSTEAFAVLCKVSM